MRWLFLPALLLFAAHGAPVDFTREVRPILEKKCWTCHGAAQQMNGLRLDDGAAALKGGYSGVAIVPGKSGESRLVARITGTQAGVQMPPGGPPLAEAEVRILRDWIDQGAVWPAAPLPARKTPASNHWSLQPVRKPAPPKVRNAAWVRNPVDAFVLARLEREGIAPSPEASKVTLLRRVSLDLTGLPPAPADIEEFLADRRADAYERQVERLLDSAHYGEKWARQWLDLAHYADSDGYEKDLARPWAWRYRNWVIDALNQDLAFDRFTVLQLAGDLLPGAATGARVATGFLRNTLTNREAGVDREEARFEQLVNRTNTVATVWLGLSVGCAQCHNHKYDPISQEDYYRLLAFFDRTEEQDIDAPLAGELGPFLEALPAYESGRASLLAQYEVPALMAAWEAKLRRAIEYPGETPEWDFALTSMKAMVDRAAKLLLAPREQRSARDQKRLEDYMIRSGTSFGLDKDKFARLKELRKKLEELEAKLPPFSQAQSVVDEPGAPATQIRIRGDWKQKGIEVASGPPSGVAPAFRPEGQGTRLDLARWLVSRENPLTVRVYVNRAWQELFGNGLVKTSEDFGVQGDKPSHPGLLDWLAADFMDSGWSVKALHKRIVTSSTYRQASRVRADVQDDPENILLARQSRLRLAAELVRDSALAAAGLLNPEIGGRSVRPPQPAGVAELGYAGSVKWVESSGRDRYRRGLYIHFQRTTPYPMLMNFDEPDAAATCSRRARSNTPLQALNLLNDEVFYEAARALAWRIETEGPAGVGERIEWVYRLCVGRSPSAREKERLARYHDEQSRIHARETDTGRITAWAGLSRVLLNLEEFITRE